MIKLYSTDCPKCKVLRIKLKNKNIQFEEVNDIDLMTSKGFTTVPMLEVDGVVYNFNDAITWIGEQNN